MTNILSMIHPSFYDWSHFGGPIALNDNPELLEKIAIANPKRIRQMSCHISSIGGYVKQIEPNAFKWGTLLGSEMIALIITALVKLSYAYREDIVLDEIVKLLCDTKAYQELLYGGDDTDLANRANLAVKLLLSQINDPNQRDILFPGGWDEHSVMYGIHKHPESNTYTFSLWNTGEGTEKHFKHESLNKYSIRIEWNNLSLEQISDPKFLKKLFKFAFKENAKNAVYKLIDNHFKTNKKSTGSYRNLQNMKIVNGNAFGLL